MVGCCGLFCSMFDPLSLSLSLSLSRPREDKARLVFRSVVQKWGHFHHKGLVFPLFFFKSKNNNRRKRKEVLIGQIVTHDTTHNNNNNRRRGGRRRRRQHDDSREDDAIIEAAEEENIKKTTSSVPPLVFGGVRERGDEQCRCWCIVVVLEMRPDDYLHHRSECRRGRNNVSSRMAVHVASDRTENE